MNNKFNFIKILLILITFIPNQFNNSYLYFLEQFTSDNKIYKYQDYIKNKCLAENAINYSTKVELNSNFDNSKRIFSSNDDFVNFSLLITFKKVFNNEKITNLLNIDLRNNLLSIINPRAPPFLF
jgi:hypothetical protein